jgi:hypothetical protein
MGWERRQRGAKSYYYHGVRVGDRVKKVYYGRGQAAHDASAAQELKRQGRAEAKKLLADARNDTEEADQLANELREWAEALLTTWLILTGHRKRRSEWRRTKHG